MEIISCKNCGRLFNYVQGDRVCPACVKKMDEKFAEVKKYVRDNPKVDINVLSSEMDVSIRQIKRWIREERLCFTDESPIGLNCENCGAVIKTGRYCRSCKDQMTTRLQGAAGVKESAPRQQKKASSDNKMRFLT
ncbi:MAG: flagellar protein [Eubacterium sp.]|nr:flagellar protein [Eubacterium sp.]